MRCTRPKTFCAVLKLPLRFRRSPNSFARQAHGPDTARPFCQGCDTLLLLSIVDDKLSSNRVAMTISVNAKHSTRMIISAVSAVQSNYISFRGQDEADGRFSGWSALGALVEFLSVLFKN